jgi:hypothetical protein
MRTIYSNHRSSDVAPEYADAVRELLDDPRQVRAIYEHETPSSDGRTPVNTIRLVEYEAPDTGNLKWAALYSDNSSLEIDEADSFDEADTAYDTYVAELGQPDVYS